MSSLQSPRSLWWKVHEFCVQLKVILCTGAFIVLFQWNQAEERKIVVTFGKYFWKNIYRGNCFSLLISVLFKKILKKDRLYRYTFWYTPLSFAEKALKKKKNSLWTNFMLLVSFYAPWKHQKTRYFLLFSGGKSRNHWHEVD